MKTPPRTGGKMGQIRPAGVGAVAFAVERRTVEKRRSPVADFGIEIMQRDPQPN
jgi:hypothetical protein